MLPEKIVKLALLFLASYVIILHILKKSQIRYPNTVAIALAIALGVTYYYDKVIKVDEDKFITLMQSYLDYYKNNKYAGYYYLHQNAVILTFLYSIKSDSPIYRNMVNKIILIEKTGTHNEELIKEILNHGSALNLSHKKMHRLEHLMYTYYGHDSNPEPCNLRISNAFYY